MTQDGKQQAGRMRCGDSAQHEHEWQLADEWTHVTCAICNESKDVDPDQAWFWTPEWQAGEREADEELRRGEYEEFDSIGGFIEWLDEPRGGRR